VDGWVGGWVGGWVDYSLAMNEPCDAAGLAWRGMEPSEEERRKGGRVRKGGQGMVESRGCWCAENYGRFWCR
jgi:hypothetical protein